METTWTALLRRLSPLGFREFALWRQDATRRRCVFELLSGRMMSPPSFHHLTRTSQCCCARPRIPTQTVFSWIAGPSQRTFYHSAFFHHASQQQRFALTRDVLHDSFQVRLAFVDKMAHRDYVAWESDPCGNLARDSLSACGIHPATRHDDDLVTEEHDRSLTSPAREGNRRPVHRYVTCPLYGGWEGWRDDRCTASPRSHVAACACVFIEEMPSTHPCCFAHARLLTLPHSRQLHLQFRPLPSSNIVLGKERQASSTLVSKDPLTCVRT